MTHGSESCPKRRPPVPDPGSPQPGVRVWLSRPSRASQRGQQPQAPKSRRLLEGRNALGVQSNPPSPDEAALPAPAALGRGCRGSPGRGGCGRAAEPAHVSSSDAASPGSEAPLALPEGQLGFPEPAQHPQGKPDSERLPKNSCPGQRRPPQRRGSEKGGGLQLSKEQSPAHPRPHSAPRTQGPLRPPEGQRLCPLAHDLRCRDVPRSPLPQPSRLLPLPQG